MDPQLDDLNDMYVDIDGTGAPGMFDVAFSVVPVLVGLFFLLFVATVVFMVVVTVRKSRRYREAGIDPLTADVDRDIRMLRALENRRAQPVPPTPPGSASLEQRLDDIEGLYRSGKITSAERDAARARLLGSL